MIDSLAGEAGSRDALDRLLARMRPKLHRYCARMTGSAVDGEDVVQDALVKAIAEFPRAAPIVHPEAWLFRIAHNAALDFLRRRSRHEAVRSDGDPDALADPAAADPDPQIASTTFRTFMRLPVVQRSSVVLMDVLGYSLQEIGSVTGRSLPAVKAALHRGRARLRDLAREPDDHPVPALAQPERTLLAAYVDRFNARDFDAIRDMLADEVRLELVGNSRASGRRDVAGYFGNYSRSPDWRFSPGIFDGRPAVLVSDPRATSGTTDYVVLLEWTGGELAGIRDFRYARYVIDGAEPALGH